ncbi:hypothetical protein [Nonlabens marinus]|uniref:Uncharacterized protein n=1 Tax=Nonlabens marinus S1-08 TaxID=1454201 RepID=W8VUN0_9FLAO|nr:hypothetical protein [Nonlabens marinus]BAO54723.1 hypothetical protein NMS_0714 [Nonlabens marinus S1-08]
MDTVGLIFGIMGMSMGVTGFLFGIICFGRVEKLTKQLKDQGILGKDYKE